MIARRVQRRQAGRFSLSIHCRQQRWLRIVGLRLDAKVDHDLGFSVVRRQMCNADLSAAEPSRIKKRSHSTLSAGLQHIPVDRPGTSASVTANLDDPEWRAGHIADVESVDAWGAFFNGAEVVYERDGALDTGLPVLVV